MQHAFLIQVHDHYDQIKNLIDDICLVEQCSVYVHVDLKADVLYEQLLVNYRDHQKVTIISDRVKVYWSNFSQVRATLNLLNHAIKGNYDYYSLISGQDYMIKPLDQFNSFLQKNKGLEFIEARVRNNTWRVKLTHQHTSKPKFRKYRYFRYYALLSSLLKYRPKKYVNQYQFYFGSSWFTITQNAVNYILNFVSSNPGFIADFETSTCGDEHFFQMILMNSHFKNKIHNDNLRLIKYEFLANSPINLSIEDCQSIENSSKFLARKFNQNYDQEVLEKLRANFSQATNTIVN